MGHPILISSLPITWVTQKVVAELRGKKVPIARFAYAQAVPVRIGRDLRKELHEVEKTRC